VHDTGIPMEIDQWEWEGMGILIVFPHTSSLYSLLASLVFLKYIANKTDCREDEDEARYSLRSELARLLADASTWPTDADLEEWDEDELRLRIAGSPRSASFKRRLGDTRGAFAERLMQRQWDAVAAAKDPSKSRPRSRKLRSPLESASATAIVDMLIRELSELSA